MQPAPLKLLTRRPFPTACLEQQRNVHAEGDLVVVAALALEALLLEQHRLLGEGWAGGGREAQWR